MQQLLSDLSRATGAWALAVMVPDAGAKQLICAAAFNLPADWHQIVNPLDGPSNNALAFNERREVLRSPKDVFHGPLSSRYQDTFLIVPILSDGSPLGTLELLFEAPVEDLQRTLAAARACAARLAVELSA